MLSQWPAPMIPWAKVYTARKTIFSFSRRPDEMVFPKKIGLEFNLSCIIRNDYFSFSRKYDLTPTRKMKDDLSKKD